jgi:hypothetical protein
MTLSVNKYGSNYNQRLGNESNAPQEAVVEDGLSPQIPQEEKLVHITPTFRHTRTASALVNGASSAGLIGGFALIPKIFKSANDTLPKWYNLAAIGTTAGFGLLFGALGYFDSKGPVKEAKYDYEMKNDVDLIPVKGTDGYKAVYNDHKVEKKLEEVRRTQILLLQ